MTDTDEIAARLRAMRASMGDWRVPQAHPGINSVEAFALLDERDSLKHSLGLTMDLARDWEARAEAAEAELARLRAPVGEVGEVVEQLRNGPIVDMDVDPPGFDLLSSAADLITRQAAENALANERAEYRVDCMRQERDTAEASLREAVEVMRDIDAIARTSRGAGYTEIFGRTRDFLAKMEKTDGR